MHSLQKRNVLITRETHGKIPPVPFFDVISKILGTKYSAQVIFSSTEKMVSLNKTYRKKTYTPNTLAFPLSETEGEIYMSLSVIRREAKKYHLKYHENILFMLIHSCLHLKGFDHGSTMETEEQKYFTIFLPHATHPYNHSSRS